MNIASLATKFSLAAMLLAVGAFGIVAGLSIDSSSLSGQHDPGPRALPLGMSVALLVCGAIELLLAWRSSSVGRILRERTSSRDSTPTSTGSHGRLVVTIATLIAYVAAVSLLGFQLATLLFAAAGLWCLGARWWSAIGVAVALVVVVRLVFVDRLHVQLPGGLFDIAF